MSINPRWALIVFLATSNGSALAACNNAIPQSTPDEAFTIHGDGTVTHNKTGLTWMRCALGQTWSGATCSGLAQAYDWQSALQAAHGYAFAGYSDWRLPNKNELASIVEDACFNPAINIVIFPNDPASFVWSSSPSVAYSGAWGVNFSDGYVDGFGSEPSGPVRLVRGGQ